MKINHISTIWGTEDYEIEIERNEEFHQAAHELSEFIKNLSLTNEQNDKLVALTVKASTGGRKGDLSKALYRAKISESGTQNKASANNF